MRFLILTQYFPPEFGASQIRLAAITRELVRLGHGVEVVTAMPNYPTGRVFTSYRRRLYVRECWEGVTVHRVWLYPAVGSGAKRMVSYASFAIASLFGLARCRRPDYVFVEWPPPLTSVPGWLASVRWGVPMILNVADLWPDSMRELGLVKSTVVLAAAGYLEKWAYRRAGYINAVTEGIQSALLRKSVRPERVLFLPNGVDLGLFRPIPEDEGLVRHLGLRPGKVIVYAGTLGFAQGLDIALQAMSFLERDCPELQLLLVGDGSDKRRLVSLVGKRNLKSVRFMEPAPPQLVTSLYSVAFAGFAGLRDCPLFAGARPSKILSIMACGKPVVYSGTGEAARLIEEARAGIVVPPEAPEELACAIRTLFEDPDLAEKLGRNARAYVEQHCGWPRLVQEWLQQLINRRRLAVGSRNHSS